MIDDDKENPRSSAGRSLATGALYSKHKADREALNAVSKTPVAADKPGREPRGGADDVNVGGLSARGPNGTHSTIAKSNNITVRRRLDASERTIDARRRQGPQRVRVDNSSELSLSFWSRPAQAGAKSSVAATGSSAAATVSRGSIHTPRREAVVPNPNLSSSAAANALKARGTRTPHAPEPEDSRHRAFLSRAESSDRTGGSGSESILPAPAVRMTKTSVGSSTIQPQPGSARERLARERERLRIAGSQARSFKVGVEAASHDFSPVQKHLQKVLPGSAVKEETPTEVSTEESSLSGGIEIPRSSPLAPFAADISHILSWKPTARPAARGSRNTVEKNHEIQPSVGDAGAPANTGSNANTSRSEGPRTNDMAKVPDRHGNGRESCGTASTATTHERPVVSARARGSIGSQMAGKGAVAIPGSATRKGVSAALGALRVRVSGASIIDEDEEDDSDDDERLQTSSGANVRRRSADSPLRPNAIGRSATLPALAPAPTSTISACPAGASRLSVTGCATTELPASTRHSGSVAAEKRSTVSPVSLRNSSTKPVPLALNAASTNANSAEAGVSDNSRSAGEGDLLRDDGVVKYIERIESKKDRVIDKTRSSTQNDSDDSNNSSFSSLPGDTSARNGGQGLESRGPSVDGPIRRGRETSLDDSDEDMSITLAVGGFPANIGASYRNRVTGAPTGVAAVVAARAPPSCTRSTGEDVPRPSGGFEPRPPSPVPASGQKPGTVDAPSPVRSTAMGSRARPGDNENGCVGRDVDGGEARKREGKSVVRDREGSSTGSSYQSSLRLGTSGLASGAPIGSDHTDTSHDSGSNGSCVGSAGANTENVGADRISDGRGRRKGSSVGNSSVMSNEGSTFADTAGNFGLVTVQGTRYSKTMKIGRGGSSEVFRVFSPDGRMLALKTVRVDGHGDQSDALLMNYWNEIELLRKLKGSPFIIDLESAELDKTSGVIHIVLELGETDLDKLIKQHKSDAAGSRSPSDVNETYGDVLPSGLEPNFVRYIWKQMLQAVHAMHEQRVVHGDLKPANFVLVQGKLKLIDFGIAKAISNDTTNISRDTQLGTLNYMCPEAFKDTGKGMIDPVTGRQKAVMKLGRASDIWSLGCILYQMAHGRPPFSHLGMVQKFQAIINPSHTIGYASVLDASLLDTLRGCLTRDPLHRPPISGHGGLLAHDYLHPVGTTPRRSPTLNEGDLTVREAELQKQQVEVADKESRLKQREKELAERVREVYAWENQLAKRALAIQKKEGTI